MLLKKRSTSKNLDGLFAEQAQILVESADMLVYAASQPSISARMLDDIAHLEHAGLVVMGKIRAELEYAYFVPFVPSEGVRLAQKIKALIDAIHKTVKKMQVYEVRPERTAMIEFAQVLKLAAAEIQKAVADVGVRKENMEKTTLHCTELHHLESIGDEIYTRNLGKLMKTADIFEIVRLKDVYAELDRCVDLAEDVGDALEELMFRSCTN